MASINITSDFALIDVKRGRKGLAKLVKDHKFRIPVTVIGYIIGECSNDDGVSIEFEIDVVKHKLGEPVKYACPCIRCNPPKPK